MDISGDLAGIIMDIFTTQLTRVVPVKIKTEQLKVKGLVKDAAASKLSDDPDHLENHDYYFDNKENKSENEKGTAEERHSGSLPSVRLTNNKDKQGERKGDDDKDDRPHLDIYV